MTTHLPLPGTIQRQVVDYIAGAAQRQRDSVYAKLHLDGVSRDSARTALRMLVALDIVGYAGKHVFLTQTARQCLADQQRPARAPTPRYTAGSVATGRANLPFRPLKHHVSTYGMRPGSNDHLTWSSKP